MEKNFFGGNFEVFEFFENLLNFLNFFEFAEFFLNFVGKMCLNSRQKLNFCHTEHSEVSANYGTKGCSRLKMTMI